VGELKVRWNEKEAPVEQRYQADSCSLENLVITVRQAGTGRILEVMHTAVSGHPNGDYNLEIQVTANG
jgi:hypothetical protein